MTQTACIKFRATPKEKARLEAAAERADTSVSALLRMAATNLAAGRPIVRNVAIDFAAVRRIANAVAAAVPVDLAEINPTTVEELRRAAAALQQIATRNLQSAP